MSFLPFLFPSCCHFIVYRVVRIVSDGCNQFSFVFFYVVFEPLYRCINAVFDDGKSSSTLFSRYVRGSLNKFPDFFLWALLLIVHTWNYSSLRSYIFRLQCTCSTVPTISGRPHGSPLVWACQWPSSQPLSSLQLSYNDSLWD